VKVIDICLLHVSLKNVGVSLQTIEKAIREEVEVLQKLRHPHIVSFEFYFLSEQIAHIGMEYIEGYSLQNYIPKSGLSETVARIVFSQVCHAVAYCHSKNVC